jgi:hypothetical protein
MWLDWRFLYVRISRCVVKSGKQLTPDFRDLRLHSEASISRGLAQDDEYEASI